MQFTARVIVILAWMGWISTINSGPLPVAPQQSHQVDDLKSKLETLQKLLTDLSKKDAPAEKVAETTTSPTTTTTTTVTTTSPPAVETAPVQKLPDVNSAEDNIRKLVSQLTPADIAALQVVRAKLINLKNKLDSENQVDEINKVLRNLVGAQSQERQSVESGSQKVASHPLGTEDLGSFLSQPLPESRLGLKEDAVNKRLRELSSSHQRALEGRFLPADVSDSSYGPFVRELYRQNILHTVKRNLLQSLKLARDSGISLREVLQALEEDKDGAGRAETELQSLRRQQ